MKTKFTVPILIIALTFSVILVYAGSLEHRVYLPIISKAPNTPTPSPTATNPPSTFTPIPTNTPTPTLAPTKTNTPTNPPPLTDINIISINPTGSEYVAIRNDGNTPVNLQNWTLSDEANHVFIFPSYIIQPGETCHIYTDENHPEWCGFNYQSGSPIWNNDGDCAYLRQPDNTLHATLCY